MKKTVYYYQTFNGLKEIINDPSIVHTIIISAIHFVYINNDSYIHLNNEDPTSKTFDNLWNEAKLLKEKGVHFSVMIGGGGGAYTELFNIYDVFYNLLVNFLTSHLDIIDGINIDIEETVTIENVIKLIKNIRNDFDNNFIISMAPMTTELMYDQPGMAGIIYKDFTT